MKIKKILKADTIIIENKDFSRIILGNKDVQYFYRSVVFSTLSFYESRGNGFKRIK